MAAGSLTLDVSDVRSNPFDQIAHAARVLSRSPKRRKVFAAVYGGKAEKTIGELTKLTRLDNVRVAQEAEILSDNKIIVRIKERGKELAYAKDRFYSRNKRKILSLALNRKKLQSFPTKTNPQGGGQMVKMSIPRQEVKAQRITIDDVDSFGRVRGSPTPLRGVAASVYERAVKRGIQRILREKGRFVDWGGETNDLYSTRMVLNGKRVAVAFGLKGRGTHGILTPRKMGKRGDQIQRLFASPRTSISCNIVVKLTRVSSTRWDNLLLQSHS